MEVTETIQKGSEKGEKKPKKYRAPWEKEGTYKHLHKDIHRIEDKLDEVRRTLRYIIKGGSYFFDQPYIHETVCTNEVDVAILADLDSAGEDGKLPKDIAAALNKQFHTRRYQSWHIRYMLRRMNRKLEAQIGERVAEKRGMRWALTRFGRRAWGLKKEELP